jgi:hypothetical protein
MYENKGAKRRFPLLLLFSHVATVYCAALFFKLFRRIESLFG